MHGIVNVRKLRNGDLKRKQTMIKILIIEDVMLPGMDGFSIVKKLRGMKVWTPIIMLTARVELQDKLQGFDAGAEDYLTKPFEIEELDARVKVLLRKNEKGEEVAEEAIERPDFVLEKNSRILKNPVGNKKRKGVS